jgi:hypothetical protein
MKIRVLPLVICLASLLSALVCATGVIATRGGPAASGIIIDRGRPTAQGIIIGKDGHEAAGGKPRPPHWF